MTSEYPDQVTVHLYVGEGAGVSKDKGNLSASQTWNNGIEGADRIEVRVYWNLFTKD